MFFFKKKSHQRLFCFATFSAPAVIAFDMQSTHEHEVSGTCIFKQYSVEGTNTKCHKGTGVIDHKDY